MKQVTINTVRERIAELEMVNSHGELSLRGEFELACLRKLAASLERIAELEEIDREQMAELYRRNATIHRLQHQLAQVTGVDDDVRNVVGLLENNEWAEHCTKTELGQRLESEITRLVGHVQPVPVVPDELNTAQAYQAMHSNSLSGCYRDGWNDCRAKVIGNMFLADMDRAATRKLQELNADNTAQQFEALAGINTNKHHDRWVNCSERLPDRFRDVPVMLSDGSQRVGRINHKDTWLMASYHQTKHQYTGDVVMWFDTPNPTSAGSGKL